MLKIKQSKLHDYHEYKGFFSFNYFVDFIKNKSLIVIAIISNLQ